MNLCILINSLAGGGAERVAAGLAEEFRRQGVHVTFACLEKNDVYPVDGNVYYLSDYSGVSESSFTRLLSLYGFARRLKEIIKQEKISIVQSHMYRANYVNVLAGIIGSPHKKQLVNHGIASRYLQEGLAGRINLFLIRRLYSRADQLVFPSQGMMDDLNQLGTFRTSKVVINNPFNVDGILKVKDAEPDPKVFLFDPEVKYIVAAGRFEKVKRYGDIIEALALLRKRDINVELVLLGDGPEEGKLKQLAKNLAIKDAVHFPGRVSNPFSYISRANILVSSSEYEGFSNVIVEALICGTPVVSSDCPSGPREILAPDTERRVSLSNEMEFAEYGVLVPVAKPEMLAVAVEKLLYDTKLRNKYSTKGIFRARDFDLKVVAGKYIACMQSLLDG